MNGVLAPAAVVFAMAFLGCSDGPPPATEDGGFDAGDERDSASPTDGEPPRMDVTPPDGGTTCADTFRVPRQDEWTERGVAILPGAPGSWDVRLGGMISPSTVAKKDGTFFLYYIGADGDRSTDGGPRHRAMGVTSSDDGVSFTKHPANPILTFLPNMNEEEGIFSAGSELSGGEIFLHYSVCDAGNATSESVNCDGMLARSSDGSSFTEGPVVLSYMDSSVWGNGDELFPIGTYQYAGTWNVFYIAKGSGASWDVGLATGSSADALPATTRLLNDAEYIGGMDPVRLSPCRYAVFIVSDFGSYTITARTFDPATPAMLGLAEQTYSFPDTRHSTFYLDAESRTWFMYYANPDATEIRVRTAPASTT